MGPGCFADSREAPVGDQPSGIPYELDACEFVEARSPTNALESIEDSKMTVALLAQCHEVDGDASGPETHGSAAGSRLSGAFRVFVGACDPTIFRFAPRVFRSATNVRNQRNTCPLACRTEYSPLD